ncbi:MAG: flagellar hook-length control protein FliK [Eubacteriales bacterium]|nr:flagellar hook-length control protein FliK [Eubacteriales bacterium]
MNIGEMNLSILFGCPEIISGISTDTATDTATGITENVSIFQQLLAQTMREELPLNVDIDSVVLPDGENTEKEEEKKEKVNILTDLVFSQIIQTDNEIQVLKPVISPETLPEITPGVSSETVSGGSLETVPGGSLETVPEGSLETVPEVREINDVKQLPEQLSKEPPVQMESLVKLEQPIQLKQTIEKVEPYSQIGEEIVEKLQQKGPTEFRLQLEPKELGQVDIKLKFSSGKLTIDIVAFQSKTQALLTSQVEQLVQSIGLQDVKVEIIHESQISQMNMGMDFSQRGQRESLQKQLAYQQNSANTSDSHKNDTEKFSKDKQIQIMGHSHRLNYIV